MGAGAGFGSFMVPPVGARVYVLYERGDPENGVYFGGWFANSDRQRKYGATDTTLNPPKKQFDEDEGFDEDGKSGGNLLYPPKPPPYQGQWTVEQGPEIPLELVEMIDHTPDSQLLFKTLKGASMLVRERDEAEDLALTDRLGAELRFESNTELLEEGVLRRGRVSALKHKPMTLDNLAFARHTMSLVTAARSGLEVEHDTEQGDSLRMQLHAEHPYIKNPELLDTRVAVEMDESEQRVRVIYKEGGEEVGAFEFDAISQTLSIVGMPQTRVTADSDITLEAPKVRIVGDLDVDGEIRHIGGKKYTFLENDLEPYGAPTRNYWPHSDTNIPQPYRDQKAIAQSNERRWW
jgi:phage baseplate assembly protein gpV